MFFLSPPHLTAANFAAKLTGLQPITSSTAIGHPHNNYCGLKSCTPTWKNQLGCARTRLASRARSSSKHARRITFTTSTPASRTSDRSHGSPSLRCHSCYFLLRSTCQRPTVPLWTVAYPSTALPIRSPFVREGVRPRAGTSGKIQEFGVRMGRRLAQPWRQASAGETGDCGHRPRTPLVAMQPS